MYNYVSGMEIDMLGSILGIKFMVLVCTTLQMVTDMKVRGMKGVSKVMACILSEMA